MKETKSERLRISTQTLSDTTRIIPHHPDLEAVVIGTMLIDKAAPAKVFQILKEARYFYLEAHQLIYEAALSLYLRTDPVDVITVTAELRKMGKLEAVGGAWFITEITVRVSSAANVEYHCKILLEDFIKREVAFSGNELVKLGTSAQTDALDILNSAQKMLFDLSDSMHTRQAFTSTQVLGSTIKHLESAAQKPNGITGVPSGFYVLDNLTSGWQLGNLITIAARPGMGKTAFVVNQMLNASKERVPVLMCSLEMSKEELMMRMINSEAMLGEVISKPRELTDNHWKQINNAGAIISELPIYIDDTPSLSVFDLQTKARKMVAENKVGLIIIDYLQLMNGSNGKVSQNREQEISYISRSLKALAKELNVPVIALSQLSREVEKRSDKKPQLSDLRESGSIEQDSDLVGFLWRLDYYGIYEVEGQSTRGLCNIIIAKHRNGPTDKITLQFKPEYSKFLDGNSVTSRAPF